MSDGIFPLYPDTGSPDAVRIQDIPVSGMPPLDGQALLYSQATRQWVPTTLTPVTSGSIATALGYTPANDSAVVKLTGDQSVAGAKVFTGALRLPSSASGSPAAGDIYRVTDTLRYRDSGGVERLILNATDNLANLSNTATARTNLGLGGSSTLNVGTSSGTVAAGDDSRFTSSTAHADLRPATSIRLPSAAPGSPGSGDIYRVTDTVRYRDSTNTERLLLNAQDNLANLGNATTARTNLGLPTLSTDGNNTLTITGPSLTGNQSAGALQINQTWNTTGTPTALDVNVTDTASNASSLLLNLRTGGTSRFSVNKSGDLSARAINGSGANSVINGTTFFAAGGTTSASFVSNNTAILTNFGLGLGSQAGVNFYNGTFYHVSSIDLSLFRDAANTLAQRNGTNAQTFRLYGTFTDTSNYRRLAVSSTTAGAFTLTAEGAGTGASGNILRLTAPVLAPAASVSLGTNGDLAFEATSNTTLTIRYRGSDGTTRSVALTLS